MLRIIFILLQFVSAAIVQGQFNVLINIGNLPPEPRGYDLYIAGSFNRWNSADDKFMFDRKGNGQFFIELKLPKGSYEYKITRGGWDKVECNKNGASVANRLLKVNSDTSFTVDIEEWQDNFKSKPKTSTVTKSVKVADTAFWIPQLNRKRRIIVYLPEDYQKRRYPVLYMHDGQNLFDDATSFAGEWGLDEYLDSLKKGRCIIVGIDNLSSKRLNEYNPYDNKQFGKGEGKEYVDFIVKTLKPYIEKRYNPAKGKANTLIAGGSMGGLISLYAVLKYPKIFGGAGIFSPAFWVCKKDLMKLIDSAGSRVNSKIYFYCGTSESDEMVPDMIQVYEAMKKISKSEMKTEVREGGRHNEPTWRKELPLFFDWLMK